MDILVLILIITNVLVLFFPKKSDNKFDYEQIKTIKEHIDSKFSPIINRLDNIDKGYRNYALSSEDINTFKKEIINSYEKISEYIKSLFEINKKNGNFSNSGLSIENKDKLSDNEYQNIKSLLFDYFSKIIPLVEQMEKIQTQITDLCLMQKENKSYEDFKSCFNKIEKDISSSLSNVKSEIKIIHDFQIDNNDKLINYENKLLTEVNESKTNYREIERILSKNLPLLADLDEGLKNIKDQILKSGKTQSPFNNNDLELKNDKLYQQIDDLLKEYFSKAFIKAIEAIKGEKNEIINELTGNNEKSQIKINEIISSCNKTELSLSENISKNSFIINQLNEIKDDTLKIIQTNEKEDIIRLINEIISLYNKHKEIILNNISELSNFVKQSNNETMNILKSNIEIDISKILSTINSIAEIIKKYTISNDSEQRAQQQDSDKENESEQRVQQQDSEKEIDQRIEAYNLYVEKLNFMKEHGYDKNIQQINTAQEKYQHWKSYLLKILKTVDDELCFEFLEILENNNTEKDRKLLTFPININDRNNINLLYKLIDDIKYINKENIEDSLQQLPGVNIRTASDLDYRINDINMPEPVRSIQKQFLNTILLIYKQLNNNIKKDMSGLLSFMANEEQFLYKELKTFNDKEIIKFLFSDTISQTIPDLEKHLDNAENYLQENFQISLKAIEIADKFEKKYFSFLQNSLLKALTNIQESKNNYQKTLESDLNQYSSYFTKWGIIYNQLINLFLDYLKEQLNIEPVDCKRGDVFNEDIHTPFLESEPDNELKNNTIKEVINAGFKFDDLKKSFVIKPVDVIVVKNN